MSKTTKKGLWIIGAIVLAGLFWAVSTRFVAHALARFSGAEAPTTNDSRDLPNVANTIPTAPDFYIHDWRPPQMTQDMHPDIAYNPDEGEYLAVFDWDWHGSGNHDVMFIVVYPAGSPAPMPIAVAEGTTYDDAYPAVAYNPDAADYLVVWQRRIGTGSYQIFGSVVTETAGAPFPIKTGDADHLYPDVAYAPGPQRFLVVWEDHGAGDAPPPDIVGASLDGAGGDIQWVHVSPEGASPGGQTSPSVAANESNGRWLVTWTDSRNGGTTGDDIYGQQVWYSGGSPALELWGGQVHIGALSGAAGAPAVAWGQVGAGGGEFLTVWAENSGVLYARRIQADNTLPSGPITVSDFPSSKYSPAVVHATNSNDWWTVWEDNRGCG